MPNRICADLGAALLCATISGAAAAQTSAISVTNAWVLSPDGAARTLEAYATITNTGAVSDRFVGAECTIAKSATLYRERPGPDGSVLEAKIDGIEIPAGKTVTLSPGRYTILLSGLDHPLLGRELLVIVFRFARAGEIDVEAPAIPARAARPQG